MDDILAMTDRSKWKSLTPPYKAAMPASTTAV